MKKTIVIDIVCALLIALFSYAAVSKFIDFERFINDINNQPFPNWTTPLLVWFIPLSEIVIALCLMVSISRLAGLYMAAILMSLFTIYTALVLLRIFDYVPCSCGGVIRKLSWQQHLFLNLFFVIISIAAISLYRKQIKQAYVTKLNSF